MADVEIITGHFSHPLEPWKLKKIIQAFSNRLDDSPKTQRLYYGLN